MIELLSDLGPMTSLGLIGLLVALVLVIRSMLADFRIAKDPHRRLDFLSKEYDNLSLAEKHRAADWYYRYANPKALLGFLLAFLLFYILKK